MRRVVLVALAVLLSAWLGLSAGSAQADSTIPAQWSKVSAGAVSTCAIDADRHLWCWGDNYEGTVGDGSTVNRTLPVPVGQQEWTSVRVGSDTACGVQVDGSGWCWGENSYGEVGDGRGVEGNEASDLVEDTPQPVQSVRQWKVIVPGAGHTCGLSISGGLFCWGSDLQGVLGNGPDYEYSTATPVRILGASTWRSVAVGLSNVCAVKTTGQAYCWGGGANGTNGLGDTRTYLRPQALPGSWQRIELTFETACGVSEHAKVKCWGADRRGQTGGTHGTDAFTPTVLETGASNFRSIRVGTAFTCGITRYTAAQIECFGENVRGQFAQHTGEHSSSSSPVLAALGTRSWSKLSLGYNHACGIRNGDDLFCWGEGRSGQLGVGNTSTYDTTVRVGVTPTVPPLVERN